MFLFWHNDDPGSGATCLITSLGSAELVVLGASGAEEGSFLARLTLLGGCVLFVNKGGLADLSND